MGKHKKDETEKTKKETLETEENEKEEKSDIDCNPSANKEEKRESEEQKEEREKNNKEIEKLKDQLLRQTAEYENYRKRTAKERIELEPEIISKTLSKLLPVLDNLDRALVCECSDPNFKKGVELINESFLEIIAGLGVEKIKTDGEDFNPNFHQAVAQVENPDMESGKIFEVFQKGYKIGEKVIRFAMVSVVT